MAVTLAVAALASGCSNGDSSTDDPGMSHVHGLGVNPRDGELYIATHYGLFRIVAGKPQRQGSLAQDTMGFTVAGPDRFLASGHPDAHDNTIVGPGMKPLLGLIESTDKGVSWHGLSLQGDVDFHALGFAHERVYGFDATSGTFMVSADMKQWESRSQQRLSAFAVSPADPDRIVGSFLDQTTAKSTDGGRTWLPVAGAAALAFLSWNEQRGLWGVSQTGAIFRSTDDGTTWSPAGRVTGSPVALLADAEGVFVATTDKIYRSSEDASTWTSIYNQN